MVADVGTENDEEGERGTPNSKRRSLYPSFGGSKIAVRLGSLFPLACVRSKTQAPQPADSRWPLPHLPQNCDPAAASPPLAGHWHHSDTAIFASSWLRPWPCRLARGCRQSVRAGS